MSKLRFEIKGDPNNIGLPTYSVATSKVVQILAELDRAISGTGGPSLNWYISDLSKNGTLSLEVQSRMKPPAKGKRTLRRDVSNAVAESFVTTFENIESLGISPPYLSEFGIEKLQTMMHLLNKNGAKGFVATSVDRQRSINVTSEAEKTLRNLLPPAREYETSIEGRLETISVHKKTKFIVYHSTTHTAITCFGEIDLDTTKDALGHKVMISGMLSVNAKNEPLRMNINRPIRIIGNRPLPLASQLTGSNPGITGGLSTDAYIRSIRHA